MTEATKTAIAPYKQKAVVQWRGQSITVTFGDVKSLICPRATDQEVAIFLNVCQGLQLNPFVNECYLIKYDAGDKAAIVIAIESYLKAAETNEHYDGCEAGIILKGHTGALEFREGSFLLLDEAPALVGGWARVYRSDRSRPTYVAVNKAECIKYNREGKPTKFWVESNQPWMLRKTALKRALVEAFPSLFAGTMASAELSGDIEAEYHEIPEGTLPAAMEKAGKPDWRKFWARAQKELQITEEQAHDLLHVGSIKTELIDQGVTMEQIWTSLVNAVQGQAQADERPYLDMDLTKESLEKLGWMDVGRYLIQKYKVKGNSIKEMLEQLDKGQATEFAAELDRRVDAMEQRSST